MKICNITHKKEKMFQHYVKIAVVPLTLRLSLNAKNGPLAFYVSLIYFHIQKFFLVVGG